MNCSYCRKEITGEPVKNSLVYRTREQKWDSWKKRYVSKAVVKSKTLDYCSGECAGNDQMAHEG